VINAVDMKTKALGQGNKEVSYTKNEMEALSKPSWINGWTRFPVKGQ
jgi:hypothetical protein